MRVLVAIEEPSERRRLVAILTSKFDVCEASTPAAIAARLATCPDVAVVDNAHVKLVRTAACPRVYVIAHVPAAPSPSQFWLAYTTGADDVIRAGACKEEVVGRVEARERIRSFAAELRDPSDPLARLAAWGKLEDIVTAELAALLGVDFTRAPRRPISIAAELPLVCSAYRAEITLGIGVDAISEQAFQDCVLGGERSQHALADALRELANTAGGALKRAALEEGVELTIGLPRDGNPFQRDDGRAWTVTSRDLAIGCIATCTSSAPARVLGRNLREGMVLTHDVLNSAGMLLASAGTYLTRTMAERLAKLVGDWGVEVTDLQRAA